jgi:CRP/FNR family cyclic AMP-dependent transcriptional regulator
MRIVAIGSNLAFIAYGLSLELTPIWVLHGTLLPLNTYRLLELRRRMRRLQDASRGDVSFEWLLPFMARRRFAKGQILFRKGDVPDEMLYVLKGRVHLWEIDRTIGEGDLLGAISVFSLNGERTVTAFCETDCEVLALSDAKAQPRASKDLVASARL